MTDLSKNMALLTGGFGSLGRVEAALARAGAKVLLLDIGIDGGW